MSTWRRKAIACLPEKRSAVERADSIYEVISILLHTVIAAHREQNEPVLSRCYADAAWCHRQRAKSLWNEHLPDYPETLHNFHLRVDKDIYRNIRGLILARAGEKTTHHLDQAYGIGPTSQRSKAFPH